MTIKPDLSTPIPERIQHAHFVGIGGSGMSGIAQMFLDHGVTVSGSDAQSNGYTAALEEKGATIYRGHAAENIAGADALVVTSALWPDNPELLAAREQGIPVLHRSQALAWLTHASRVIAVAGAHGKTTTTGMLATALLELGADPSFVNGGVISSIGRSAHLGEGDLFVVEADESDATFLLYDKVAALITNIDTDHLDTYGTEEAFEDAFVTFANESREFVVVCADDERAMRVAARVDGPEIITYGTSETADVRLLDVQTDGFVTFQIEQNGVRHPIAMQVPGAHNAINATGAFAVLTRLGYAGADVAVALERFTGTKRRFELHEVVRGVSVYDDYAHHPTEVEAALTAARTVVGSGRIIAVHQPHLYSRTRAMAGAFAEVYERTADYTVVLDVCGAREDPIPGVTGELVVDRFHDGKRVSYQPDWDAAAAKVAEVAREGDFVVTLGCGDVYRIIPSIVESLGR